MNWTTELTDALLKHGFKRKYAVDRNCFWYEKLIKTNYLGVIELSISDRYACVDISNGKKFESIQVSQTDIRKYTPKQVIDILSVWKDISQIA